MPDVPGVGFVQEIVITHLYVFLITCGGPETKGRISGQHVWKPDTKAGVVQVFIYTIGSYGKPMAVCAQGSPSGACCADLQAK
jgi:hypothetical protein